MTDILERANAALSGAGEIGMYDNHDQARLWSGLVRSLVAKIERLTADVAYERAYAASAQAEETRLRGLYHKYFYLYDDVTNGADGRAEVKLPEPDSNPDTALVIDAVTEGLEQVGAVITVAEDDDDPGTPGIRVQGNRAVCLYDLNNEISSAFLGFARSEPEKARDLAAALLATTAGPCDESNTPQTP